MRRVDPFLKYCLGQKSPLFIWCMQFFSNLCTSGPLIHNYALYFCKLCFTIHLASQVVSILYFPTTNFVYFVIYNSHKCYMSKAFHAGSCSVFSSAPKISSIHEEFVTNKVSLRHVLLEYSHFYLSVLFNQCSMLKFNFYLR